nr:hypothetical protein [Rickettsia canadensis]
MQKWEENLNILTTLKETNEQLRENALNTVVLDTAGISTLDFKDAQKIFLLLAY